MQHHKTALPAMTAPSIPEFVTFVIERLKKHGHQAYIVGGALRNASLQLPIIDWDVSTSAPPREVKALFQDVKHFALKHGTVTLVLSAHHLEVTPFRGKDHSLEGDLARRDFTINAMALDPGNNEIIDPFGARRDIDEKVIRAVENPHNRFQEDPLRLLRAVRLATQFGFRIEEKTMESLTRMSHLLHKVAPERIREELIKVLMSPKPSTGFTLMRRTGLLKQCLPELLEGYRKQQNAHHRYTIYKHIMETVDRVEPVMLLRLTALFHDIAKPRVREKGEGTWRFLRHEAISADLGAEILARLRFSNNIIRKVVNLVRHHMIDYESQWSDAAIRRLIRRVGPENIVDLIKLRRADTIAHGMNCSSLLLLNELEERIVDQLKGPVPANTHELAINGHTIMAILGLLPGPEVGSILSNLMEKVIDKPELNTKSHLTTMLKQIKASDST